MKINGVGISDYTSEKQVFFRDFLRIHMPVAKGIIKRNANWCNRLYVYGDLTAGPGFYESEKGDTVMGSPCIFYTVANEFCLPFDGYFIERDKKNRDVLEVSLHGYGNELAEYNRSRASELSSRQIAEMIAADCDIHVGHGDYRNFEPTFPKPAYGLFYLDPSGEVPCFDTLGRLSRLNNAKYIDILINISATNIKRIAKSPLTKTNARLHELLKKVDKKHWLIREPYGRHQWTFLLGTNWADFPAYKKGKFHRIGEKKGIGKDILARLSMTRDEYTRLNGELSLFDALGKDVDEFNAFMVECEFCGLLHEPDFYSNGNFLCDVCSR